MYCPQTLRGNINNMPLRREPWRHGGMVGNQTAIETTKNKTPTDGVHGANQTRLSGGGQASILVLIVLMPYTKIF